MPKLKQQRVWRGLLWVTLWSVALAMTWNVSLRPAVAARSAGYLTGVVVNSSGAVIVGARVFWQAADGKSPHVLRTDKEGRFRTPGVSAGLYELRAEGGGMWSEWEHNILVRTGTAKEMTLRLIRRTPPEARKGAHTTLGVGGR